MPRCALNGVVQSTVAFYIHDIAAGLLFGAEAAGRCVAKTTDYIERSASAVVRIRTRSSLRKPSILKLPTRLRIRRILSKFRYRLLSEVHVWRRRAIESGLGMHQWAGICAHDS
jgi:hypothetical protein